MSAPALLVLASSSPYRRELLAKLQLPFETVSPAVDESALPGEEPAQLANRLAISKARAVANRFGDALIIGSDQVATQGGEIIGKPENIEDAVRQLLQASGNRITLHTGLALLNSKSGRLQSDVLEYRVHFRELSEAQARQYLQKEYALDCAGSLKSEGLGIALLQKFEGDDPNILVGLPLIRLIDMLANEGLSPLQLKTGVQSRT